MRTEPRKWEFIDNPCLFLFAYEPINVETARIKGCGKLINDRVRVGDTIIINTVGGKGELIVDEIQFQDTTFEAVVTLGEEILSTSS